VIGGVARQSISEPDNLIIQARFLHRQMNAQLNIDYAENKHIPLWCTHQ